VFENIEWEGVFQLKPYPIYDGSKRFKRGMYIQDSYQCLSFHTKKLLKIGKGGMILTNDEEAFRWFKLARNAGRNDVPISEDTFEMIGWNMYMTPEQAARGILLMDAMPDYNPDQTEEYPDLSKNKIYTT